MPKTRSEQLRDALMNDYSFRRSCAQQISGIRIVYARLSTKWSTMDPNSDAWIELKNLLYTTHARMLQIEDAVESGEL